MENLGEYLKKERELRGVGLEDLSTSTMLSEEILGFLEADDFDNLPHRTFVRGYIKSYCKELGLDNTEALLRYEQYLRDSGEGEVRPQDVFVGDVRDVKAPISAYGASVLVFSVLIAFLYFFMTNVQISDKEVVRVSQMADSGSGSAKVQEETATLRVIEKAADAPLVEMTKSGHNLVVRADSTTWISVEIDPDTEYHQSFEVTLAEGEKVSWKATKVFFWS